MTGMHVGRFGDPSGRPVVALHGITAHGGRWRRIAEEYLPGHRTLAPDLRGHGRSSHNPPWTVERHAGDVLALLDDSGIEEADVVGHSFGGLIAVHVTRMAPERVRRLVLLDPSIGLPSGDTLGKAHAALSQPSWADPDEARDVREKGWPEAYPGAVDDEMDHLVQGEDGRWRWRYEPAAVVTAFSEMARTFVTPTVPTHLVVATRAGIVRPVFVNACRRDLGDDFAVTEIDAGHLLYLDRLDETGAILRDWLGD
ncbi:alpha/beta hydrolase [Actinomadura barringtoniae]|uniref:Alpha/beta hydrolase n=1 Tax=Actinomadura barringtoniae TaxID=1427535 RepID=A0A939TA23_9ACTN|nr:alpha/beta hydrolase [Actinomadura barringtoniae]MBO2455693.1 alpha/beta hydrolase [Actinomadura barringtoniae]